MKKNYKAAMDTHIIKNCFVGVVTGLVISFLLMILATICIENETIDISYVGGISYMIHFASAFLAVISITTIIKNTTIYISVIIPTVMSLFCCAIAILLFDGLCITVLTKALTLITGGVLGFFVKKALPGAKKVGKRRSQNW